MEQNLHIDGRLNGSVAGWRAAMAALVLACLSLVFCALIIEASLRASAAKSALPMVAPVRAGALGVRDWLAGHSVLYQAVRQRVAEVADRVKTAG
jgi:hypothetical protein